MTRPLPLSVPINARPPSDRLPLAFRRPLGGKPEDGGHAPSVPGRIPVAKSWGFAAYEAADAAVCAAQAQAAAGVSLDWAHLPKGSAGTSACIAAATADTAALHLDRTAGHTPSVRRAGCTRTASKDASPLRHCGRSTTAAAAPRYRCTPAPQTAAGRLKTCIRPRHGATDGAGIYRHGRTAPAADIHTCRRTENETAKIPPCEYYPLPIPEPQPDGNLKTYICEPRPKADRMHLRFRRKKLGHAADRIPLAFACHTVQGVPVRKAYIMLNRVTASFDNGKPLDILAASFAADTGGYCWQCSVTLPPDSFARLNMDGRDKGKIENERLAKAERRLGQEKHGRGENHGTRPLQNSFSPDSRNLVKDFRLFLFQISTDSTQIPPLIPLGYLIIRHPGRLLDGNRRT